MSFDIIHTHKCHQSQDNKHAPDPQNSPLKSFLHPISFSISTLFSVTID